MLFWVPTHRQHADGLTQAAPGAAAAPQRKDQGPRPGTGSARP